MPLSDQLHNFPDAKHWHLDESCRCYVIGMLVMSREGVEFCRRATDCGKTNSQSQWLGTRGFR